MSLYSTEKVTDIITRIILPGNVYAYLAEGTDRAVLIDTGLGIGDLRAYVESLLNGKPYEVILTHGHLDHAGGAVRFDKVWIREEDIAMSAADNKSARAVYTRNNGYTDFSENELDDNMTEGYSLLEYGQHFDLGDEELEIICFGGHTVGSIGILFKNERILLTGDACCSFSLLFGGIGSLSVKEYQENLIKAWDKYQDDVDEMLYSHPHNYGGPQVIPEMIELCQEIIEGRDDHIATKAVERPGCLAKEMDENMHRVDGKIANLVYPLF